MPLHKSPDDTLLFGCQTYYAYSKYNKCCLPSLCNADAVMFTCCWKEAGEGWVCLDNCLAVFMSYLDVSLLVCLLSCDVLCCRVRSFVVLGCCRVSFWCLMSNCNCKLVTKQLQSKYCEKKKRRTNIIT